MRLTDLAERRVITMANPYRLRRRVDEAFATAGVAPRAMIDANASLTALALARRGLGVAIIEPASACGLPVAGVVLRPLDVGIPFLFGAISPAARPLTPSIAALNEALLKSAATLIPGFVLRDGAGTGLLADAVYGSPERQGSRS